jgi:hypothetical protein
MQSAEHAPDVAPIQPQLNRFIIFKPLLPELLRAESRPAGFLREAERYLQEV